MVTIGSAEASRRRDAEPSRPPQPAGQPRRGPIVVATLLTVVIAVLLLRPGGPTLAADTEHVRSTRVLPFLKSGQTLTQRFTATDDDLSQVMIRFAVGDGVTGCRVSARVVGPTGVLAARQVGCGDLRQAEIWTLDFEPVADSRGGDHRVEVTLQGTSSGPMSLWGGPSLGTLPVAELDNHELDVSAELHTAYGDDRFAVQQLGTALDRIDGYGPVWHEPWAVVTLALVALGALVAVAGANRSWGLALVVVFAVAKGVLWSVIVPPMEGPDEQAHFAYAQFMAEQHRIPERDGDPLGIGRNYSEQLTIGVVDVYHQTSQWPGNRADFSDAARDRARELQEGAATDASGAGAAAGYAPYYYVPATILYWLAPDTLDDQLAAMRLWSVALGAVAAALAVLIGRRLFPSSEPAALALGVAVAAQPMLSQQMAVVNNDAMVVVAGFACLLVALELAEPLARRRLLFLGGIAAGLALATKPFGVAWAPVLAAAWAIGRWRSPAASRRPWLGDVIRAGAGMAITYGTWLGLSILLQLPPTAVQTFNPEPGPRTLSRFVDLHTRNAFKPLRERWIDQFWGNFGGLTLAFPTWTRSIITALAGLTIIGLIVWTVRVAVRLVTRSVEKERVSAIAQVALCASAVVAALSVLHIADFLQYLRNGRLELVQGRYALMVLPAAIALPALLMRDLVSRRLATATITATAAAVVGLNLVGLSLIVERYYL